MRKTQQERHNAADFLQEITEHNTITATVIVLIHEVQSQQSLTFQHFHSNSEWLVGLLLVDADGLGHHHLTEAALAQRFTQSQPETKARKSQSLDFCCKQH